METIEENNKHISDTALEGFWFWFDLSFIALSMRFRLQQKSSILIYFDEYKR